MRPDASCKDEARAAAKRVEEAPRPADPGDSTLSKETPPRKAVSIRGMVGPRHGGIEVEAAPELCEVRCVAVRLQPYLQGGYGIAVPAVP